MCDFHQAGSVTTIHRLRPTCLNAMEDDLLQFSRRWGMGLVLPASITEFERPAMARIIAEVRNLRYLKRIVVAVGRATRAQLEEIRPLFADFQSPVTLLWLEDPRIRSIFRLLQSVGMSAEPHGKGRTCWLSFGYLMAEGGCDTIAIHDCDVVNHSREMVARLFYPAAHPDLRFEFCKGYSARTSDRMHEVTSVFLAPLVRALRQLAPNSSFLSFLGELRYALAGEFSISTSLAKQSRIPGDWGLGIGVLSEVHRNATLDRVCQVDLSDEYEHKHLEIRDHDSRRDLRRMTLDIGTALLRGIASEGTLLTADQFNSLGVLYQRTAEDMLHGYQTDALVDGLCFDRHQKESAVRSFAMNLQKAANQFCLQPEAEAGLPSWRRLESAIPGIFDELLACGITAGGWDHVPNWNAWSSAKEVSVAEVA